MTVFVETNVEVDLHMLRSFRVLRPLKLSKIPSESEFCERAGTINTQRTKFLPVISRTNKSSKWSAFCSFFKSCPFILCLLTICMRFSIVTNNSFNVFSTLKLSSIPSVLADSAILVIPDMTSSSGKQKQYRFELYIYLYVLLVPILLVPSFSCVSLLIA